MIHRIEVGFKPGIVDALGQSVARSVAEDFGLEVHSVNTVAVYTTNIDFDAGQLERLGRDLFADPVIQHYSVDLPLYDETDFDWLLEVGFRPGVTDNVGHSAAQGMKDMLGYTPGDGEGFFTSLQYLFKGVLERADLDRIARDLLANNLIEHWQILNAEQWAEGSRINATVPLVSEITRVEVKEYNLEVADEELLRISDQGTLSLSLDEMQAIQAHYRKQDIVETRRGLGLSASPTDVELECLAQTWSEHCKHKIFNCLIEYHHPDEPSRVIDSLFKTFIRRGTEEIGRKVDWLVSVFHDNAGMIAFDPDFCLSLKVETHNSPSALDPYGGAITGIVGVNRDVLGTGLGCRMIFNTDVFCFARPDLDTPLPGRLLHPKRIFTGVHRGVRDGGNESGIPTVNGAIVFDDRFRGKPLVFCGTGGIIPSFVNGRPCQEKVVKPGDRVVMVGGRIGKDGIHGATFSSVELDESSPASAVQIGDPITQKKMADCLLEARDLGLFRALTDNGAGGLSSSVGEMACLCGGAELYLERAPLKYAGLSPWEILLSEAQERMTLAVPPDNLDAFLDLCRSREVEATDLGVFTDSGLFQLFFEGKTVGALEMDFLHDGLPLMKLEARWQKPEFPEPVLPDPDEPLNEILLALLDRYNICSKESFVRQYDHEVQAATLVKPFTGAQNDGPSDAAVVRPLPESDRGVAVGCGIIPRYSDLDTYHMAACCLDEALRNIVAVGARPDRVAVLDNFCWPDPVQSEKTPDGSYKLAQLVRACQALYDYCTAFGAPLISGKDSMKNDYGSGEEKISIPPTLLVTSLGIIDDVKKAVTMDLKQAGDLVYVVGESFNECGASEYFALLEAVGNTVPQVDAARSKAVFESLHNAISKGLVASCHDISDGGLGVALAESSLAGDLGMTVDLELVPGAERFERDDLLLFSESQGRFVVTVPTENRDTFEEVTSSVACALVGVVTGNPVLIIHSKKPGESEIISLNVELLRAAWKNPLAW
jgi:phosphoribosylformylglycinamidine synthase subunit PurSL